MPPALGATRVGGIDLNKPRMRVALAAALALTAAPRGFTVAEFTTRVQAMTGQARRSSTELGTTSMPARLDNHVTG